jgi:hypothetical protein
MESLHCDRRPVIRRRASEESSMSIMARCWALLGISFPVMTSFGSWEAAALIWASEQSRDWPARGLGPRRGGFPALKRSSSVFVTPA